MEFRDIERAAVAFEVTPCFKVVESTFYGGGAGPDLLCSGTERGKFIAWSQGAVVNCSLVPPCHLLVGWLPWR